MKQKILMLASGAVLLPLVANAAIVPDRTRIIFSGGDKSVSVMLKNDSPKLPYLAQTWVEDSNGQKISSPLTVLPPVQRIEPQATSQVKVQGMPALSSLPQDRETMFYFNVREIPPKSEKANTLQIALQTRIKLFYRPTALPKMDPLHPWQFKVTLMRQGDSYVVKNPTSYYVILSSASDAKGKPSAAGFEPMILAPGASQNMKVKAAALGNEPVLVYVNDYGGRMPMYFHCSGATCSVDEAKSLRK